MTREQRVIMIQFIHHYYADKKFCRLDLDKLTWSNNEDDVRIPYSHPIIKYLLFIENIKDRNRLQNILSEIVRHNSYEVAKRIFPGIIFSLDGAINDLKRRIRSLEIKIELFHSEYSI